MIFHAYTFVLHVVLLLGGTLGQKKKNVLVLPEAICTHLEFGVRRGNVHFSYVPRVAIIYHRFVLQAA